MVLWVWANFFLDRDRLPRRRVLVRFEYPTLPGAGRRSWLLIERGDAEYCLKYPGGEEELIVVVNDPWRSPAGTLDRSSGVTPCAPGRSKSRELLHWPARYRPGTAVPGQQTTRVPDTTDRPSATPPRRPWPLPPDPRSLGWLRHSPALRFTLCASPTKPQASRSLSEQVTRKATRLSALGYVKCGTFNGTTLCEM